MKRTNRILSVMMTVLLVVLAMPTACIPYASASDITSGQCGDNVFWSYDEGSATLTISGEGEMWNFDGSNRPWEAFQDDLETVIIEDGVRSVGDMAFLDCVQLTDVTIPDSVKKIGQGAFQNCELLMSLNLPANVTTIGELTFYGCCNLKRITVDAENPAFASDDSGCLYNKDKTVLLQYPVGDWRTSFSVPEGVTHIGKYAFFLAVRLREVQIPDSVTTIDDGAFFYCTSLETVTIPRSVRSIGEHALTFTNATSIYVDERNSAFSSDESGCLYNIDKTILIQYPTGNERTCFSVPDSVNTIGFAAFSYGDNLLDVTIPSSVTRIEGEAFRFCNGLTEIKIPNGVTSIGPDAFGCCDYLTDVTISNSVTDIEASAFVSCGHLARVTIGNGVKRINCLAFSECGSLTDVYYVGSEEEWNRIEIDFGNDPLLTAAMHYIPVRFTVAVAASAGGTVNGGGTYEKSAQVTLTAVPDDGYHFAGWFDGEANVCADAVYTFTVSRNMTLTAKFAAHQYAAAVTIEADCETAGSCTYTCPCGSSYTEPIPALGHIDEGNDGSCDRCGEKMTGNDHCPQCGKIHNGGFFDSIAGFFHRLIYRLTHLFG